MPIVVANETSKTAPAVREAVDWRDTLDAFIADGESKGVDFTHWKDKTLTAGADSRRVHLATMKLAKAHRQEWILRRLIPVRCLIMSARQSSPIISST